MRIRFETYTHCDEEYSSEQFGDWYANYETTYLWASIVEDRGTPVDFDVKVGDTVYLLYVVYGSGDSFGRSTGNVEEIWVYNNQEDGQKAATLIRKDAENKPEYYYESNQLDIGLPRPIFTGTWKGHFECFEDVCVVPLVIRDRKGVH